MKLGELYNILGVQLLSEQCHNLQQEIVGFSIDSRTLKNNEVFIAIRGKRFDGHDYMVSIQANMLCAICEIPDERIPAYKQLLVSSTVEALGKIASLHFQQVTPNCCWIVNGSNGKTTTKNILYHLLAAEKQTLATSGNFNNEIGLPLTIFGLNKSHECVVLEIGANHLGEIRTLSNLVTPTGVIVTNASNAHLQGFGSLDNIRQAKGEALLGLDKEQYAILNYDDVAFNYWYSIAKPARVISVGYDVRADVLISKVKEKIDGYQFLLVTPWWQHEFYIPLCGKFNIQNAAYAIVAATLSNISVLSIKQTLRNISSVEGRFQIMRLSDKITVVNDAYNANPASVKQSIIAANEMVRYRCQTIPTKLAMFMGDLMELGESEKEYHAEIGKYATDYLDWFGCVGVLAKLSAEMFAGASYFTHNKNDLVQKYVEATQDNYAWVILIKGSNSSKMEECIPLLASYVK